MKNHLISYAAALTLTACALAAAAPAQAGTQHVTVTTGALNGAGTYYVEFTLTDGSGLGDGNSFAGVSNFSVNGGSLGAVLPPTTGDVTGSLGAGHTLGLTDSNAGSGGLADFAQGFTITNPSATLGFDLTLTDTSVDPVTPDGFTFQLLDGSFNPIATTGPTGTELVGADFTSISPGATGYSSNGVYSPPIIATISPVVSATVPEPSAYAALALGALTLGGVMLRGRRRARVA
ncbi:hypothetical protein CCAX7_56370 [Capsulimonas corticalis]|uniref:Uncharacterized protein n=1 Tax=Capsulimonas corticalis TaxID=2219043 RepID=A0A402D0M0_9BACT|nr:NF038129 family PEP-CTERM protein [Capsulimonas corticalis]BDI33586.1 hypothetical protein CCAX7_56370 [Capsulimonas corticalis]